MLGVTPHPPLSKIWDKRLPLYRGTPSYFPCYSYGCSHHQCLFCFWIRPRSPPLCFLHFPPSWRRSPSFRYSKKGHSWISCIPDYFGYPPPLSQTTTCSFWQPVYPKFLPCFRSPATPTSFPFLLPPRRSSPDAGAISRCEVAQHFSQGLWIKWPNIISLNPCHFVQLLAPMSPLGPSN